MNSVRVCVWLVLCMTGYFKSTCEIQFLLPSTAFLISSAPGYPSTKFWHFKYWKWHLESNVVSFRNEVLRFSPANPSVTPLSPFPNTKALFSQGWHSALSSWTAPLQSWWWPLMHLDNLLWLIRWYERNYDLLGHEARWQTDMLQDGQNTLVSVSISPPLHFKLSGLIGSQQS